MNVSGNSPTEKAVTDSSVSGAKTVTDAGVSKGIVHGIGDGVVGVSGSGGVLAESGVGVG